MVSSIVIYIGLKRKIIFVVSFMLLLSFIHAQFIETPFMFNGMTGPLAFGDYDNDGDLDVLVLNTSTPSWQSVLKVYRNDGNGIYTDINVNIPTMSNIVFEWGDFDNDGFLDFYVRGYSGSIVRRIYKNESNDNFSFTNVDIPTHPSIDCNNDGSLDVLTLSGIYENVNGDYILKDHSFDLSYISSHKFFDIDNDGDYDLVISGTKTSVYYDNDGHEFYQDVNKTLVYIYESGVYSLSQTLNDPVKAQYIDIGDYDNDGYVDMIISGNLEYDGIYWLFRNNMGIFELTMDVFNVGSPIHPHIGRAKFGDLNNNGYLDLLVTGTFLPTYSGGWISQIRYYQNIEGVFSNAEIIATSSPYSYHYINLCDYNNDGKLDFVVSRWSHNGDIKLFTNTLDIQANVSPSIPGNLYSESIGDYVFLHWNASSDDITPSLGLSYTIRVGTSSESEEIFSSSANIDGKLKIPSLGYAGSSCCWRVHKSIFTQGNNHYWSVQAIDSGLRGSAYSVASLIPIPDPEIELLSSNYIDFGSVIKNETSDWIPINLRNIGLGLQIESVTLQTNSNDFELGYTNNIELDDFGATATIMVRFTPTNTGHCNDIINIVTNAVNHPVIQINLSGTGLLVPPKSPNNIVLSVTNNSVFLHWQPVTEDIHNNPLIPDGYIVLFSEDPSTNDFYWFLGYTTNCNITHYMVATHRKSMFYRIVAIKHENNPRCFDLIGSLKTGDMISLSELFGRHIKLKTVR